MAWIAAGAAIGGALLSRSGQSSANKSNQNLNAENRAFQERMSSTAHQREAKDLEAAGLNRILSVKQSGASTPGGSVAKMENTNKDLGTVANSAMNATLMVQQLKNAKAQEAKTNAETVLTVNQAKKSGIEASLWDQASEFLPGKQTYDSIKQKGQDISTKLLDLIMPGIDLNSAKKINSNKDMFKQKHVKPNPDMPNKHRKRKTKKRIRR